MVKIDCAQLWHWYGRLGSACEVFGYTCWSAIFPSSLLVRLITHSVLVPVHQSISCPNSFLALFSGFGPPYRLCSRCPPSSGEIPWLHLSLLGAVPWEWRLPLDFRPPAVLRPCVGGWLPHTIRVTAERHRSFLVYVRDLPTWRFLTRPCVCSCVHLVAATPRGQLIRVSPGVFDGSRVLPSPCTAFSQSVSVNSFRWRIRGERSDHVTQNALAARNNEA